VVNESATNCWNCMHDPCACNTPLVWDNDESAYYVFSFSGGDGETHVKTWMSKPKSDFEKISYLRKKKKRKEREETEREEEECHEIQKEAHREGFCCPTHAAKAKSKIVQKRKKKLEVSVNGPWFCAHCEEDPCVFIQSEQAISDNDTIYFDEAELLENPKAVMSARRKRAFQFTAHLLWEGINYRRQHYTCVEAGVRALFPPPDGKIMGYKVA
jgi:hypothetical protein